VLATSVCRLEADGRLPSRCFALTEADEALRSRLAAEVSNKVSSSTLAPLAPLAPMAALK